jgi:hypothetical protein
VGLLVLEHPRSDFTGVPPAWSRAGGGRGASPNGAIWAEPEAARLLVVGLLALGRHRLDFEGVRIAGAVRAVPARWVISRSRAGSWSWMSDAAEKLRA